MKKNIFVNKICEIWSDGLSVENVQSGFRSIGIYPVDRSKYPVERFDKRLERRYEKWVGMGKPEDMMESMATQLNTPKKRMAEIDAPSSATLIEGSHVQSASMEDVAHVLDAPVTLITVNLESETTCQNCVNLGPKPSVCPPPGSDWFPSWMLLPISESTPVRASSSVSASDVSASRSVSAYDASASRSVSASNASASRSVPASDSSFEEMILDRMKGPVEKTVVKRRKVDMKTKVITQEDYLETLRTKEKPSKVKLLKRIEAKPAVPVASASSANS